METLLRNTIVYKDDNVRFDVQELYGKLFIHCDVTDWKPSVLRNAYRVFATFKQELREMGVEEFYTATPNPKFAKLFGGSTVAIYELEGKNVEVIRWELKPQ